MGEKFELRQPDGTSVPVVVWGDEYYQRVESPEGHTLVRNRESGWICYAALSADSTEFVATDRIYQPGIVPPDTAGMGVMERSRHARIKRKARLSRHAEVWRRLHDGEAEKTAGSSALNPSPSGGADSGVVLPLSGVTPVVGSYTGLTILIDFSDEGQSVSNDSIEDFLNKRDYTGYKNNGSVRDYYYDVSGGRVDYQNHLFGYYRAANPKTYYDNSSVSYGVRAQELVTEALNRLDDEGFDFSTLSTAMGTRTRYIRAINILYAGSPTQGWSEGLWPHQGTLSGFSADGVSARKYQITSIGSSLGIGTFCHENGHMLFNWPDLYDYGGESQGVGVFCIMCGTDSKNPAPPCAYLRDFAGWDAVTDITGMAEGTVLSLIPSIINATYMYRNESNSNEMFYIEARRRADRYKTFADSGFLIWHVDRDGSNDNEYGSSTSHYLVSLEQADNRFDLENGRNGGGVGDLFRGGYKERFCDTTEPNANWWSGSASGLRIWNMSEVADTMSFSIGPPAGSGVAVYVSFEGNGMVTPSGRIVVPSGSPLTIAMVPDSGYRVDRITVDGSTVTTVDTLRFASVTEERRVDVQFGLAAALSVVSPGEGDVLYAGDTATVEWHTRGVTLSGVTLSYSVNGGGSFTSIGSGFTAADSMVKWKVPAVESDSCLIRAADFDGSPVALSGSFSIRKKPVMVIDTGVIAITVEQGASQAATLIIGNSGTGALEVAASLVREIRGVVINELSVGPDNASPDGMEIWNSSSVDIDMGGWELMWEDNKTTSGSYTFPEGFTIKGGAAYVVHESESDTGDSAAYCGMALQWNSGDSLAMSISLLNSAGLGVDFIRCGANVDMPPEGASWKGEGIVLCSAFVCRESNIDKDSSGGWICTETGSMKRRNSGQTLSGNSFPLELSPRRADAASEGNLSFVLEVDAESLALGNYADTLIIEHNDPARSSPLRIPCAITVKPKSSAVAYRSGTPPEAAKRDGERFSAAPNPARRGEKVLFRYLPEGGEREGRLMIYDCVGNLLYSESVDLSHVWYNSRQPLFFSWPAVSAAGVAYGRGTFAARLVVRNRDGSSHRHTTMVGIR